MRVRDRYSMTPDELTGEPLPEDEVETVSPYDEYADVPDADMLEEQDWRKTIGISARMMPKPLSKWNCSDNFSFALRSDTNSVNVVYKRSNGGYGVRATS
jgi:hypothetical protein